MASLPARSKGTPPRASRRARDRPAGSRALLDVDPVAILDGLPDAIVVYAPDGRIQWSNRRALLLGVPDAQVVQSGADAAPGKTDAAALRLTAANMPVGRALRGETVTNLDLRLALPSGERRNFLVCAAPGLGDEAIGAVVVLHDIATRGDTTASPDVLAFVGHELKTPLSIISGYVQLVLRWLHQRRAGDDYAREMRALQIVEVQMRRLAALVSDLLDAARVDKGTLQLNLVDIDLVEFLRGIVDRLAVLSTRHQLRLAVRAAPEGKVVVDPVRLDQVLINLITNAIKYSPTGGVVEITLETKGDGALIAVRDEGIGISATDLPRVFERHYRGSGQASAREGMGLGLYVTRQIVALHGGEISVESRENVGSTFRIWLPAQGPPEHRAATLAPDWPERVGRILDRMPAPFQETENDS